MAPRRAGNSLEFTLEVAFPGMRLEVKEMLETVSEQADNEDEVANDLLDAIFSSHDTRAVKSKEEIVKFFAEISHRRDEWIQKLALERGVTQPASWGEYTTEQWRSWLSQTCLSPEDMDEAIQAWKHEFEMNDFRETAKVEAWRKENTCSRAPYGNERSGTACGRTHRRLLHHQIRCEADGATAELGDAVRVRFEAP